MSPVIEGAWRDRMRLALGILLAGWLVQGASGQTATVRIPNLQGTTFAGQTVTLPEQLKGRVGVLVLGFSKSSGDVCKGWGLRLDASYGDSHDVEYYQMPELESVPKLVRGMVLKSMRSSVPEVEQAHFMPIFSNQTEWQKVARYGNADDAYVLVVDGDGSVLWQTEGKVTDAGFATLKQQVDMLRARLAPATPR